MYQKLLHFIYLNADLPYLTKKIWFLFHLKLILHLGYPIKAFGPNLLSMHSIFASQGLDQKPLASLHSSYERIHVKKIVCFKNTEQFMNNENIKNLL